MRSLRRKRAAAAGRGAEQVVLVDGRDRRVGVAPKMAAHRHGWRHRALSVFVFNDRDELLLQKRSPAKYHSGGLWSNTCCGHPRPGERVARAAQRRLHEEMGFDCHLHRVCAIQYSLDVGKGLVEREYLHLFVGRWNGQPVPAPDEVSAWRWCAASAIDASIATQPARFTAWFPLSWRPVRHALHGPVVNRKEGEFRALFDRFEHEYGAAYVRLAAQLRERYPEITKPGRRTGKALRNIGFFVWCCCRDADRTLIPTLFHAAVLLSAQDDYYDNPRIPAAQKESFCTTTNHALRTNAFRLDGERSLQLRELTSLWSYVAGTIPRSEPQRHSYWIETACQLNDAMAAENRMSRRAALTYEEYMRTAIYSIGMVYFWATYLAREHVPMTTVREIAPVLLQGARVVRLTNDMASYRQGRNKDNAVTLAGGSSPAVRILRIVVQASRGFRASVEAQDVSPPVRGVLLHSMDFLREFYLRSDFDRAPAW